MYVRHGVDQPKGDRVHYGVLGTKSSLQGSLRCSLRVRCDAPIDTIDGAMHDAPIDNVDGEAPIDNVDRAMQQLRSNTPMERRTCVNSINAEKVTRYQSAKATEVHERLGMSERCRVRSQVRLTHWYAKATEKRVALRIDEPTIVLTNDVPIRRNDRNGDAIMHYECKGRPTVKPDIVLTNDDRSNERCSDRRRQRRDGTIATTRSCTSSAKVAQGDATRRSESIFCIHTANRMVTRKGTPTSF